MGHRIYHSIDRPTSFFGLRGRYVGVAAALCVLALVPSLAVGAATQMLLGAGTFISGCAGAYLLAAWAQSRTDERDLPKVLSLRRMPRCWSVNPSALRSIWKGIN